MSARVRREGPSRPSARLHDYLPATNGEALHTDGREVWREVHRRTPAGLVVERWSRGDRPTLLDLTEFELPPDRVSEVAHRRTPGGENLLPRPITLDAELAVGAATEAVPGVRITLVHAGPIALITASGATRLDAIGLCADTGAERRIQWLARGEGVVALGPLGGPPTRWRLSACTMSPPPEEPLR